VGYCRSCYCRNTSIDNREFLIFADIDTAPRRPSQREVFSIRDGRPSDSCFAVRDLSCGGTADVSNPAALGPGHGWSSRWRDSGGFVLAICTARKDQNSSNSFCRQGM